jgi:dolichol-phosphate mannosyltransferase
VLPLRLASFAGATAGALGLLGLVYTLSSWLLGTTVVGWTSVATLILIIGGIQLLMLGIFGEYLGRLYMEAKRRPLFVVDAVLCAPGSAPPGSLPSPVAASRTFSYSEALHSAAAPRVATMG